MVELLHQWLFGVFEMGDYDKCDGCLCLGEDRLICLHGLLPKIDDIECPCRKCIIKMCCDDSCEKFNDYETINSEHLYDEYIEWYENDDTM